MVATVKKTKKRFFILAAVAMITLIVGLVLLKTGPSPWERIRKGQDYNCILITVDTLRADRIGCYGFSYIDTPTMDLFASRGIKFERCFSQTPLTLPSHTTIMSGTLPLFHGVRDNGGFVVPKDLKTLAEVFKSKGYDTAAFIGAYVLDSKWGLNKGFDYYFDQFDLSKFERISLGTVQRPGNEVMDEALRWLEKKKGTKHFAWIHLYDPHTPYDPPPPYDKKYRHPYLGEIAFADSQLGRLWQFLKDNNLLQETFVVFASDHGESLGEHLESAHGFLVYQGAIHVPLIVVTPFPKLQGLSCPQVVSLSDIMPTILEMEGVPVPSHVQGKSLLPLFFHPQKTRPGLSYAETFYPRFHYGWSELKSVQNQRYKLILAPVPELYDLREDPKEEKNLVYLEKKVYEELNIEAQGLIQKASQNAYEMDAKKIDEETREKLAALGYIGSFTDPAKLRGKILGNPKEKIVVFNELCKAREMGLEGDFEEAEKTIKAIIDSDPDIIDAYFSLGNIFFKQEKYRDAILWFEKALERKPDDTVTAINIGLSYERMGKFEEAETFVLGFINRGFPDSQLYFLLGNLKYIQKKYDEALQYLEKCLTLNSESAASHNMMTAIYVTQGDLVRARQHIEQALQLNPRVSNAYFNQAQIYEKEGKVREAVDSYLKELQNSPKHFKATYNLTHLYRATGETEKEYEYLKKCLEIEPRFPLTYFYLARIYLNRGERYQEAIDFVKKGIELKPDKAELPLGYFLLADLYNRVGDSARSQEYAGKGQALAAELKGEK
jgi:arylsulfatase A-like enzyme/Tfp pilus assembly protein PilF